MAFHGDFDRFRRAKIHYLGGKGLGAAGDLEGSGIGSLASKTEDGGAAC